MNITLKRYKTSPSYTVSRLTVDEYRDLFTLDMVEPPLAGMTFDTVKTLDPGIYKLFLKPDILTYSIVPTFQKVAQRPRICIRPLLVAADVSAVECIKRDPLVVQMLAGRITSNTLMPDKESFERFMTALHIAKQKKEKLFVYVK